MRRAAHCMLDPAACAPAPSAGHWARRTRALPGCECVAVGGVSSRAVGSSLSRCLSRSSLSLRLAGLSLSPPVPIAVSLSLPVFPFPGLFVAPSLSHYISDPAVSISPCILLPLCPVLSSLLSLVQYHCPCAPPPKPTPSVCLVGWEHQHDHRSSCCTPWQPQAGLIQVRGLEE